MKNTEITTALESSETKSKKDDEDNVCKVIICNYIATCKCTYLVFIWQ